MSFNRGLFESHYIDGIHKSINLNYEVINQFTIDEIIQQLSDVLKVEKAESGDLVKLLPSKDVIEIMALHLLSITGNLVPNSVISASIMDLLRSLRNCAVLPEVQDNIVEHPDILNSVHNILSNILRSTDPSHQYLKLPFQFLINLVTANQRSTVIVYNKFNNTINDCLDKNICIYECSALIYNISRFMILSSNLINKFIKFANSEHHNEYILFFVESMISSEYLWNMYKEELNTDCKLVILEFLKAKLLENEDIDLDISCIDVLSQEFIKSAETIFYTDNVNGHKAYKVSLTLQILSSLTSNEKYLHIFQKNKDLLISAGAVLINIHKLGKISDNCFTPLQKLPDFGNDVLNQHPAFGFKADLIRIIGNLCWKSVQMQNLARTAELIPVILDCCNMDAKNPFIIQWCILAIRNFCEGNLENQKVIAGLHQEGNISGDVLEEMGMSLHNDGEQELKIISLSNLKNKK